MNLCTDGLHLRIIGSFLAGFLLISSLSGCGNTGALTKAPEQPGYQVLLDSSAVLGNAFTGFMLYDPAQDKVLFQQNASHYFTPASNNKLFTFYAGLVTLGDSLPGLIYVQHGDSLIFQGTGDPAFLYWVFRHQPVYNFLNSRKASLYFDPDNFDATPLGPGWSWDDLNYYYAPERSPFPIYGNIVRFRIRHITHYELPAPDLSEEVIPRVLVPEVRYASPDSQASDFVVRHPGLNRFSFYARSDTGWTTALVPFHYTPAVFAEMLADTLHRPVGIVHGSFREPPNIIYGIPTDSLYRHMLLPSDNFLAEQLLLMCSQVRFRRMAPDSIISFMKRTYLRDLPDPVIWVDGSGMSRYNLETPRNMVMLLKKINGIVPDERLFQLLPAGGVSGTLKDWYKADQPYIFAKTGTLRNNHCLSGYLITKSGRKLIFSLMVNHYITSTQKVREAMENLLSAVHEEL